MSWRRHFAALADHIDGRRSKHEVFTASLAAEDSDFIRFNRGKTRQADSVRQHHRPALNGGRTPRRSSLVLTGDLAADCARPMPRSRCCGRWCRSFRSIRTCSRQTPTMCGSTRRRHRGGDVLRRVVDEAAARSLSTSWASRGRHPPHLRQQLRPPCWYKPQRPAGRCLVHGGDEAVKNTWWLRDPEAFSAMWRCAATARNPGARHAKSSRVATGRSSRLRRWARSPTSWVGGTLARATGTAPACTSSQRVRPP